VTTRRLFLQSSAAGAAVLASNWPVMANSTNAPGVTEAEIKFGQSMPYSGPASIYGVIGRTEAAYFNMVNETDGVNGRKLTFISLDDGYSPSKAVEQTRRLVEQEKVAFIYQTFGSVNNIAIRQYLNENGIPQLFCAAPADLVGDPQHFPWTIGLNPAITSEARIYAKQILLNNPGAKIGILYQDDTFGKTFVTGILEGLGQEHAAMIVKEAAYQVSDPTVDSQVLTLQGAGADTLIIAATPKAAAQAIRKAYDVGWSPDRYLFNGASSVAGTLKPAGLDRSKGLITALYVKDPNDPRWQQDPGLKQWTGFASKYLDANESSNSNAVYGFDAAILIVQVLKQCGEELSHENIMRQALNIAHFELPMGLPGTKINTSSDNYFPMRQMQLARFNGESWDLFGEVLSD
jgi:branched-chain amino acid transport system substrate-binding protein